MGLWELQTIFLCRVLAKEGRGVCLLLKFSLMWSVKPQECFNVLIIPLLFLSWLKHCPWKSSFRVINKKKSMFRIAMGNP